METEAQRVYITCPRLQALPVAELGFEPRPFVFSVYILNHHTAVCQTKSVCDPGFIKTKQKSIHVVRCRVLKQHLDMYQDVHSGYLPRMRLMRGDVAGGFPRKQPRRWSLARSMFIEKDS